jgi:hypothetical protein
LLRARATHSSMIYSILASVLITQSWNSFSCHSCWSLDLLRLL